ARELTCNLQRLVNDHSPRCLRIGKEFRYSGTNHVAIYGSHALHAPVLGVALDDLIDFVCPFNRGAEQVLRKPADFFRNGTSLCPERSANVGRVLLPHISLEEHLQSEFAGFAAGTHWKLSAVSYQLSAIGCQHFSVACEFWVKCIRE